MAANCPKTAGYVTKRYLESIVRIDERVQILEGIRDVIVKASYWCGIPRAINAAKECMDAASPEVRIHLSTSTSA
jgi:hypothetical protein